MRLYNPLSSYSSADAAGTVGEKTDGAAEGVTAGVTESISTDINRLFECPSTTSIGMNALLDASHRLHALLQEEKHGEYHIVSCEDL